LYIDTALDINISHSIVDVLLDATSNFIENIDLQEQILFTISNIITTDGKFLISLVDKAGIIGCLMSNRNSLNCSHDENKYLHKKKNHR
jgi:di/tripeptidase